MAQRITRNNRSELHIVSDATGYLNLNGGSFPANSAGETLTDLTIREIFWSSNATWTVQRGGNTIGVFSGSGNHDYQGSGFAVSAGGDDQANVAFTLTGGAAGVIGIKLGKQS
tara:strand:+ start:2387 stop:2725 length:339 start_codon:yes stop_codon:yes gene_type:complete